MSVQSLKFERQLVLRAAGAGLEVFGRKAELDDEVVRKVFRLDLAPFFPPQAEEGAFVMAHDDPGVRPADEE
jgi:hypothetical protein